jgi:hypothetical protein
MFSLRQQISGNHVRISRLIRYNQDLGWPSKEINADLPKQLPFRLCNESVSGARNEINLGDGFRPDSHCRYSLDATNYKDLVCTRKMHSGNCCQRYLA